MSEEKKTGRKLTQARKEANARYNSKFVEVKVRMTPERRSVVQDHAASMEKVPPLSSTVQLMRL